MEGSRIASPEGFPAMKYKLAIPGGVLLLALLSVPAFSQESADPVVDGQPLSFWIKRLGSDKGEDRLQAAGHLVRGAGLPAAKAAVPTLREALKDRDAKVRMRVAPALKQITGEPK
jgi:hypothetical protein